MTVLKTCENKNKTTVQKNVSVIGSQRSVCSNLFAAWNRFCPTHN